MVLEYVIRRGDTLTSIARRFGTTIAALVRRNAISDPDRIVAGKRLKLPQDWPKHARPTPELGSLSRKYEVGANGCGTVSSGQGDPGGVSYGSYQLSTRHGRPQQFLAQDGLRWAEEFAGAAPGSAAFSATWKAIAAREPEAFEAAQTAFIRRTHYDPQVRHIRAATGFDVEQAGIALRNVVWSVAVQHGPNTSLVADAIRQIGANSGERDLIEAIYRERSRQLADGRLAWFRSSSPAVQRGVARRFAAERADALAMLG